MIDIQNEDFHCLVYTNNPILNTQIFMRTIFWFTLYDLVAVAPFIFVISAKYLVINATGE